VVRAIASTYDGAGALGGRARAEDGAPSRLRAELNEDYLRRNIVYRLAEGESAGLREFYRRALALGLISRVPELTFYGGL
jgi:hypothetical protein